MATSAEAFWGVGTSFMFVIIHIHIIMLYLCHPITDYLVNLRPRHFDEARHPLPMELLHLYNASRIIIRGWQRAGIVL